MFKGPTFGAGSGAGSTIAERRRVRRGSADGPGSEPVSRSGSVAGKAPQDIMEEDEDEGVEEVDAFSPVVAEDGVRVEILDEGGGRWVERGR